jgi:hypothetical protein
MKQIIEDYFILVSIDEIDREEFEKFQGQTFPNLEALYEELGVEEILAYTTSEFLQAINDNEIVLDDMWVIKVHAMIPEPRYAVIDRITGNVAKVNLNKDGVNRYLQGKDLSQYHIESIN